MAKRVIQNKRVLVNDKKYEGKYVAFDSSKGKKIVASGKNPGTLIEKARKLGVSIPAIVFVAKGNVAYSY